MKQLFRQMGLSAHPVVLLTAVILCGAILEARPLWAQGRSHITVLRELGHDTSPPLDKIPPLPPQSGAMQVVPLRRTRGPFAPHQTQPDPVVQTSTSSTLSANVVQNFLGLGKGFSGPQGNFTVSYIPPDTNGAVGATQYVQWVNASFAVFDKATGNPTYGPAAGNTLWSGFSGANRVCSRNNDGDPIVQYDKIAKRWVLMQPVFRSPYYICVAVSQTSDATGKFDRYVFPVPSGQFPDYPKLSVWPDGYYLTFNQFQGNFFTGAAACVMDRNSMLSGQAATMQCATIGTQYGSLLPADLDGSTPPPDGSPGYFLDYNSNLSSLDLWKFTVDWNNPSNSTLAGPLNIGVAPFSEACGGGDCIPQQGTTQTLDSLGDRLMYRLAYRNFGDHESMVVSHSVDTGNGITGIRWYELRQDSTSQWDQYQQGTYAPDDGNHRWMASIAMDGAGNIAMGYSVSGTGMSPTIRFTGWQPGDASGIMEGENDLLGTIVHGSQTNYNRWGDYSSMTVDPVDDCTFWYTTEYQPTDGYLWSTRIASFRMGDCGSTSAAATLSSVSLDPASVVGGDTSTGKVTLSTSAPSGGVTVYLTSDVDSVAQVPSSVTVSGGQTYATFTVNTSAVTATTLVNITGDDGVSTQGAILTVNPVSTGDFSLSASPGNRSIKTGSSTSYTISVTASGGYAGTVDLSATSDCTTCGFSFTPSAITGSGSATLNVTTGQSSKGSYTITIYGTDSSGGPMHSTSVGLKLR